MPRHVIVSHLTPNKTRTDLSLSSPPVQFLELELELSVLCMHASIHGAFASKDAKIRALLVLT
jgi:hypothetical protein